MLKYGFLIENGEIYDTHRQVFKQKIESVEGNIIYSIRPYKYKRLYKFEVLLYYYPIDEVFERLRLNSYLKRQRAKYTKLLNMLMFTNKSVIYEFPPTYLTRRRFEIYKTIKYLEKNIE